jgi:hypothetical protein
MPEYTDNLGLILLEQSQSQPSVPHNDALVALDKAVAGRLAISLTGLSTKTLTGAESTNHILHVTATSGACDLVVQNKPKSWIVVNDGSHTVTVKRASQSSPTPPTVAAGTSKHLYCDGTNVRAVG